MHSYRFIFSAWRSLETHKLLCQKIFPKEQNEKGSTNVGNKVLPMENDSLKSEMFPFFDKPSCKCERCNELFSQICHLGAGSIVRKRRARHNREASYEPSGRRDFVEKQLVFAAEERTHGRESCQKSFKSRPRLYRHKRIHSGIMKHKCETFRMESCRKCTLKQQLMVHMKKRKYMCEMCHRRFNRKENLRKHIVFHTKERKHECKTCQTKFKDGSVLDQHIELHHEGRKYECETCHKRFHTEWLLELHSKDHTPRKKHECETCKIRFSRKYELERHKLIHKERKWK